MGQPPYESERYEGLDRREEPAQPCEYYKCTFVRCNFEKADLSGVDLDECVFEECDLTMAKFNNSGMRDVVFRKCKLMGVDFSVCNPFRFGASFNDCVMTYSIFYKLKIPRTVFRDCRLGEAVFGEADLTSAVFDNCSLAGADFAFANLEKADMRTARHYTIDPEKTRLRKARFSYPALLGLLSKYDIITDLTE